MRRKIKKRKEAQNVRNASRKAAQIVGTNKIVLQIGKSIQIVNSLVVCKLATSVILGYDFCDAHVEAIKPRLTVFETDDRSTVPIIRQPSKPNKTVPPSEEQEFNKPRKRASTKRKTTKPVLLKPETQTWVEVTTKRSVTVFVDPYTPL